MRAFVTRFRVEQPLWFFGGVAVLLAVAALIFAVPLLATYLETGLVPRFPTAILATGLMILAALNGMFGLILDTVVRGRRALRRLAYVALAAPAEFARRRLETHQRQAE